MRMTAEGVRRLDPQVGGAGRGDLRAPSALASIAPGRAGA
jgi:hypothetical protein